MTSLPQWFTRFESQSRVTFLLIRSLPPFAGDQVRLYFFRPIILCLAFKRDIGKFRTFNIRCYPSTSSYLCIQNEYVQWNSFVPPSARCERKYSTYVFSNSLRIIKWNRSVDFKSSVDLLLFFYKIQRKARYNNKATPYIIISENKLQM